MSTMSTEHGALWATEFGTLPSSRIFPFMPLFPTTIRSRALGPGDRHQGVGRRLRPGVELGGDTARLGLGGQFVEQRVRPVVRVDVATGGRAVGAGVPGHGEDDVQRGVVGTGQVDGGGHRPPCRFRWSCADDDVREHDGDSSFRSMRHACCRAVRNRLRAW